MALAEDLGPGDLLDGLGGDEPVRARIESRNDCVLAGTEWAEAALSACCFDRPWELSWAVKEGGKAQSGSIVAVITAPGDGLLMAERTMLNFLQLLSGVATRAREIVDAAGGVPVYDTRKTIPGMRLAQKHAAQVGGMSRNRASLCESVIIKENHIEAAGSVAKALSFARKKVEEEDQVQIEVNDQRQLEEALAAGAKRIMLDNFSPKQAQKAVASADGKAEIEASGGISAKNAGSYAKAGVDRMSSGLPTKSPASVDFSLLVE